MLKWLTNQFLAFEDLDGKLIVSIWLLTIIYQEEDSGYMKQITCINVYNFGLNTYYYLMVNWYNLYCTTSIPYYHYSVLVTDADNTAIKSY